MSQYFRVEYPKKTETKKFRRFLKKMIRGRNFTELLADDDKRYYNMAQKTGNLDIVGRKYYFVFFNRMNHIEDLIYGLQNTPDDYPDKNLANKILDELIGDIAPVKQLSAKLDINETTLKNYLRPTYRNRQKTYQDKMKNRTAVQLWKKEELESRVGLTFDELHGRGFSKFRLKKDLLTLKKIKLIVSDNKYDPVKYFVDTESPYFTAMLGIESKVP